MRLQSLISKHSVVCGNGEDVVCKTGVLTGQTIDRKNRLVKGTIGMTSTDMEGEVIVTKGIDTETYFMGPEGAELGVKTVYWDHDYSMPVAKCVNLSARDGGLYSTTYVSRLQIGDDILTLIDEGILRGLSIGVLRKDFGKPTPEERKAYGDGCSLVTRTSLMLEYSFCPMPAHKDALIHARSLVNKSLVRKETYALLGGDTRELATMPKKKVVVIFG